MIPLACHSSGFVYPVAYYQDFPKMQNPRHILHRVYRFQPFAFLLLLADGLPPLPHAVLACELALRPTPALVWTIPLPLADVLPALPPLAYAPVLLPPRQHPLVADD